MKVCAIMLETAVVTPSGSVICHNFYIRRCLPCHAVCDYDITMCPPELRLYNKNGNLIGCMSISVRTSKCDSTVGTVGLPRHEQQRRPVGLHAHPVVPAHPHAAVWD